MNLWASEILISSLLPQQQPQHPFVQVDLVQLLISPQNAHAMKDITILEQLVLLAMLHVLLAMELVQPNAINAKVDIHTSLEPVLNAILPVLPVLVLLIINVLIV